ncbi:hypothetical protein pEaSNUABM35_00039 [Erwinia phage pEa_SNUABM_35]|uniref:Uncharacterized protein n=1 Tax=Erwinia phage pEa_SNUABM_35 TaxID=2869557 RepID=A0AAE7XQY0_9CAUD|nr:hypothetical protein MPK65_gp039 [Erwinia phage pEa_SNUABM_35]QZE59956.1 hypothetical protein pEaSNUABM35_00039 [Erwinia phage pEa_SNUABM_35]QZE60292.1 hypothetical protein pEaSNUABM36_00039 [Erwinia phage pEa_SNUABM_36]
MKNIMLIQRISAFLYVGFAENIPDIPRRGVEKFDVLIPDGRGFEEHGPILTMKARCIYHLPHNCFLIQRTNDDNSGAHEHPALMKSHCKLNMELFQRSEHGREQTAVKQILDELHDAEVQHPQWPEEAIHAASIVTEEAGELLRDCATFEENGDQRLIINMLGEATQVGAMAVRFMKNLPTSQRRTIPNNALRSILDSDMTPEQQLIEVRRLMNDGVQ